MSPKRRDINISLDFKYSHIFYRRLNLIVVLLTWLQNFAAEIFTSHKEELQFDHVKQILVKAGGANYGTGK